MFLLFFFLATRARLFFRFSSCSIIILCERAWEQWKLRSKSYYHMVWCIVVTFLIGSFASVFFIYFFFAWSSRWYANLWWIGRKSLFEIKLISMKHCLMTNGQMVENQRHRLLISPLSRKKIFTSVRQQATF